MLPSRLILLGSTAALFLTAAPAVAEDAMPQTQYVLDLGAGVMTKPRYDGSDSYLFSPMPIIAVGRFYIPGLGQVADGKKEMGVFFYRRSTSLASASRRTTGTCAAPARSTGRWKQASAPGSRARTSVSSPKCVRASTATRARSASSVRI